MRSLTACTLAFRRISPGGEVRYHPLCGGDDQRDRRLAGADPAGGGRGGVAILQSWRATLIVVLAIPVSLIGTFAVLYLLGYSANTLSLFAIILALTMVVDDAIVVVENVETKMAEGLDRLQATARRCGRSPGR